MKRTIALGLTLVLMLAALSGCAGKGADEVVMRIDGTEIMKNEVDFYLRQVEGMYEQTFGPDIWDMEVEEGKTLEQATLEGIKDTVIRSNILVVKAQEMDLAPTAEEQTSIDAEAKQYFESMDAAFIKDNQITLDLVKKMFLSEFLSNKVYQEATKDLEIDQDLVEDTLAMDTTYQGILEDGAENYNRTVRAQHILIKTVDDSFNPLGEAEAAEAKAKAEEVLAKAKAGEDFAALVQEYSQDTASLESDGELTFGRSEMVPEFEQAAYSMQLGEIRGLVETTYGYHILKLNEVIPATAEGVKSAEDQLAQIRTSAEDNQKRQAFNEILEGWVEESIVELDQKVWDKVKVQRSKS
ncbi:peptidylprolyl isomerase [Anaerotalea alkaliphila]|uniref:PpiC domain-containing protein n=1 Tax=Anaerotalea alkaliphila TaxID=2662126 RepID=A0A7X5KLD7_9FIRM|nr:peptidylprolyl isomerase [Anaerotalea alkaliphila]NDL66721.1 hypothetical protein [Anaerotalea alkaliphila]